MNDANKNIENSELGRKLFAGEVKFVIGCASLEQLPNGDRAEVAFAGRSNVGKSSLINALTNRKGLARSSTEPGRTREMNFFDLGGGKVYLVDLPGFGYAKVSRTQSQAWMDLTRAYLAGRANLKCVFYLIDSRRGIMPIDTEIMTMLDKAAVSYRIILTKIDKLKMSEVNQMTETVTKALVKHPSAFPLTLGTSAVDKEGLEQLRTQVYEFLRIS